MQLGRLLKGTDAELADGIPIFLDQIIETLRIEQTSDGRSPETSRVAGRPPKRFFRFTISSAGVM